MATLGMNATSYVFYFLGIFRARNDSDYARKSRAMEYLRTLVDARKSQLMPYISEADDPPEFVVNFSPSRHHPGIISSNIDILPRNLPIPSIETNNIAQTSFVGDAVLQAYIDHPLSNAVDSDSNTFFISPDGELVCCSNCTNFC